MAFVRRAGVQGGVRRPVTQSNGAPRGFGQMSPYLDQPQEPQQEFYDRSYPTPEEEEEARRRGEYQRQPVGQPQRLEEEQQPAYLTALNDLEQESGTFRNNSQSGLFSSSSATKDNLRKQTAGPDAGSFQRSSSNPYDLGNSSAMPRGPHTMPDGTVMSGSDGQQLADGYTIHGTSGAGVDGAPNDWANRKLTMDDILAGVEEGYVTPPAGGGEYEQPQVPPSSFERSNMPQGSMWGDDYRFLGAEGVPSAQDFGYGDTGRVSGFATDEWGAGGDPNYDEDSLKNFFGKLASQIDPGSPGARDALMARPEFVQLFPNATAVSFDKIDFGDGNPIDVMINGREDGSGQSWSFQDDSGGGGFSGNASGDAGGAASDWDQGYAMLSQLDPNLEQSEMEAAIERIFGGLPGYGGAYKESVMRDGDWKDMVIGYGAPGASWGGFMSKGANAAQGGGYGGSVGQLALNGLGNNPQFTQYATQLGLDGNSIQQLLQQMLQQEDEQRTLNTPLP